MRVRIGELLIQAGAITRDQLGQALRHQQATGARLGSSLIALGFVDEKRLTNVLSAQLRLPAVTGEQLERVPGQTIGLIPVELARSRLLVPVREDSGKLWVALAEPGDPSLIDELWRVTGLPIRVMVAPERVIREALDRMYGAHDGAFQSAEVKSPGPLAPSAPLPVLADDSMTGFLDEAPRPARKRSAQPMTFAELTARLAAATQDDAILDAALGFVAQFAGGAALYLIRSGEWRGYNAIGIDLAVTRAASAPLDELPFAQAACVSGEPYLGAVAPASFGRLAAPLGVTGSLLAMIVPVRVGKRASGCIIGVDVSSNAVGARDDLERLALKLDYALHIVHLRRLLLAP